MIYEWCRAHGGDHPRHVSRKSGGDSCRRVGLATRPWFVRLLDEFDRRS